MIRVPQDPDDALVRACLDPDDDGFERAFEELYGLYRDRVFGIAYRMLGTTADAMDVVQEAFSLVFRKISGFRFDSKFSTWLFRIVVNCCVDQKRRDSGRSLAPLADAGDIEHEFAVDPVQAAETIELGDHVHLGLQRLSPKLRAVLVLRYIEDLSYEEVAAALDVSLGTVKSRLARAHVAFESVLGGTLRHFDYPVDPRFARGRLAALEASPFESPHASLAPPHTPGQPPLQSSVPLPPPVTPHSAMPPHSGMKSRALSDRRLDSDLAEGVA